MKKTIYFFCLLSLILTGNNLRAQSPIFSLTPQSQCYGVGTNTSIASLVIWVPGATSYSWSVSSPSSCAASVSTFSNGAFAAISYPCCGVYSITCTAYNTTFSVPIVLGSSTQTVTIYCPGSISISTFPNPLICAGSPIILHSSGYNSYTWTPGNFSGDSIVVTPSVTTCYTVTGTSSLGCTSSAVKCVTVGTSPILSVSGNTAICAGSGATLTASGASTYTWMTSQGTFTGSTVVLTPSASTCFSLIGSNSGCTGVTGGCISVQNTNLSVSGPTAICGGASATLVASGAQNYTWQPGGLTGSVIVVSPSITTCYTIQGSSSSGCSSYGFKCVSVQATSATSVTASNYSICSGDYTTLYASGASNYTWLPGGSNALYLVVSPSVSTCYTLTGSGCSGLSSAVKCITVNPSPIVSISGNTAVCSGGTATLTASGASSYIWYTGSGTLTGSSIVITPTTNNCYTALGQNSSGCQDSAYLCVYIQGGNLGISGNSVICSGASTTLSASGAQSYTWLPGNLSGSSIVVSPSVSTCYTVLGTTSGGCSGSAVKCIIVNQKPTITTIGTPGSSCAGASYTLSAGGASSYTWIPFNQTGANIVITPTTSMCYTVIGMNSFYCTNTAVNCFSVLPASSITILGNNVVCSGAPATLSATGAQSYTWLPSNTIGSVLSVTPSVATCYTVLGSNSSGCFSSAVKCLSVQTGPTITASGMTSVCAGSSATLFANGAQSYTWLPGNITGAVVAVTPSVGTCYTVVGTNANGCIGLNSLCLQVLPKPTVTSSGGVFCAGQQATLAAQGASTYTWLPVNQTGSVIAFTPSVSSCFTVIGTSALGCTNSALSCFSVTPTPSISVSGNSNICAGASASLSASGANSYYWMPGGMTGSNVVLSPPVTTCYTVLGYHNNGCVSHIMKCITVLPTPTISVSGSGIICAGNSANFLVSGANTYTWSNGSNSPLVTVSPSVSSCYTVSGTSSAGCIGSAVKCISVQPQPLLAISGPTSVCFGSNATLVASGASSYVWNTGSTSSVITVGASTSTVYTVTGSNGVCTGSKSHTLVVIPKPNIQIFRTDSIINGDTMICAGTPVSLYAVGATSYSWNTGSTSAFITVSPSVTTTYTVSGTNASGCSNSNAFTLFVAACTGITKSTSNQHFGLYPNPSRGEITLQAVGGNKTNYTIYDLLGRTVMSGTYTDTKTIDLSAYSNGTYLVRFESGSVISYQKVILEK